MGIFLIPVAYEIASLAVVATVATVAVIAAASREDETPEYDYPVIDYGKIKNREAKGYNSVGLNDFKQHNFTEAFRNFSKAFSICYRHYRHEDQFLNNRDSAKLTADAQDLFDRGNLRDAKAKFQEAYDKSNEQKMYTIIKKCLNMVKNALAEEYFDRGIELSQDGEFELASELFSKAANESTADYYRADEFRNAERVVDRCVEAQNLWNTGYLSAAERIFEEILDLANSSILNMIISKYLRNIRVEMEDDYRFQNEMKNNRSGNKQNKSTYNAEKRKSKSGNKSSGSNANGHNCDLKDASELDDDSDEEEDRKYDRNRKCGDDDESEDVRELKKIVEFVKSLIKAMKQLNLPGPQHNSTTIDCVCKHNREAIETIRRCSPNFATSDTSKIYHYKIGNLKQLLYFIINFQYNAENPRPFAITLPNNLTIVFAENLYAMVAYDAYGDLYVGGTQYIGINLDVGTAMLSLCNPSVNMSLETILEICGRLISEPIRNKATLVTALLALLLDSKIVLCSSNDFLSNLSLAITATSGIEWKTSYNLVRKNPYFLLKLLFDGYEGHRFIELIRPFVHLSEMEKLDILKKIIKRIYDIFNLADDYEDEDSD